ncbi:MAG: TOBE domain-containing protein, partial [Actinomycetota bacterium]
VAVFDSGRIVQVGPPRDVYLAPRTRFVADFIGEANILEGTASAQTITVTGFGALSPDTLATDSSAASDGQVFIAVRPESVAISSAPDGNGTVVDATFVGGDMHVDVKVGDVVISARQAGATPGSLSAGDIVRVAFPSGSVRVVEA